MTMMSGRLLMLLAGVSCFAASVLVARSATAGEAQSSEPPRAPVESTAQPAGDGGEGTRGERTPERGAPDGKLTVDQILAETLTEDDYGDPSRCIDMKRVRSTKILDRQHVAFRSSNRKIWLVKLIPPCRSLDYDDVLSLPTTTGRLCRLDSIYTIDRASGIPGVPCKIDTFREITKEQYDFLREELKKHRNR
jgi:hypothetical protein